MNEYLELRIKALLKTPKTKEEIIISLAKKFNQEIIISTLRYMINRHLVIETQDKKYILK